MVNILVERQGKMGNRKEARKGDVEGGGGVGGSGRDGTWGTRGTTKDNRGLRRGCPEPCWCNSRTNAIHVIVNAARMVMPMVMLMTMMMMMLVIITALMMAMMHIMASH